MADEAKNGIPNVDKSPESTQNDENEVKSPIVMRIDAPDSAPATDSEPAAAAVFCGARGFPVPRTLGRVFPAACVPARSFHAAMHRVMPAAPSQAGPSGGGDVEGATPAAPRPLLLRPSSLAVHSDVSSSEPDDALGASAPSGAGLDGEEAANSSTATPTATAALPPTTQRVKFVPLAGATPALKDDSGPVGGASGAGSSLATGFVFGQNLRARAVAAASFDSSSASARPSAAASTDVRASAGPVGGASVGVASPGFVFGQNLQARAATAAATYDSASASGSDSAGASPRASASTSPSTSPSATASAGVSTSTSAGTSVGTSAGTGAGASSTEPVVVSNGTADAKMVFPSAAQSEPSGAADGAVGGVAVGNGGGASEAKSLSEAAAEYEEARAVKRTYQRVAVFTGEEEEDNVQQVNCRLYSYDAATGQYVERGRGPLRLNDRDGPDGKHSRVVMRTVGSLRVVLNTKVWAGMQVDRASPKGIRITAMEGPGQVTVFLVMATRNEIDGLYKSLQARVAKRRAADPADPADPAPSKRGRAD